jgi:hypothetical protein
MSYFEAQLKLFNELTLCDILRSAALSRDLSQSRFDKYALIPLYPKEAYHRGVPAKDWHYREARGKSYSLYLDAENAFALCHRGIPQIIVGFERAGVSIMVVEQIQLVHPYTLDIEGNLRRPGPDGLYRFSIDTLKVNLVESWARFNACDKILVVAGSSQRSAIDAASAFASEQAEKKYDCAFRQVGYYEHRYLQTNYFYKRIAGPLA